MAPASAPSSSPAWWLARLARPAFVVLLLVVAWLALTPAPPKAADFGWDKLNHASAFLALAFTGRLGLPGRRALLWLVLGLLAFGGGIELVQAQVGRDAQWSDWLADAVGIVAGLAATWWVRGRT
jgi:VanZ family protein